MIHMNFTLRWPKKVDNYVPMYDYVCKTWVPTKNKFIELQISKLSSRLDPIISFKFAWTQYEDHAGVELDLELFGFMFVVCFRDSRHWDDEKGQWEVYE